MQSLTHASQLLWSTPMDRLENGASLGPYRILHQIGEGGMAKVYKAFQANMERYVALKVLPAHYADEPQFAKRFIQEARTIARLEHKNILPVYDFGEHNKITYLVMRYLEGGTLKDVLSQGRLTLHDTLEIMDQVCSALDYAHRQGVIHRDVKPANIMIDAEGAAYLTDFGIAKVLGKSSDLTATGVAIGTPAYMAPEQAIGEKIDGRTDLYALGVVLYEMILGRVPFKADTPMAVLMAHLHDPLPLPSQVEPDIHGAIENVIIKALAKEPEDRYQSATAMMGALRQAIYEAAPESLETTLVNLISEIRASRDEGPAGGIATEISDPLLLEKLEKLYIDGLSAYWVKDWERAQSRLNEVISIDPNYKDAAVRLADIEKQHQLVNLHQQAQQAIEGASWESAQRILREILSTAPNDSDAKEKMALVERQLELASLYAQGEQLFQAGQWRAVINIFERIHQLEKGYPDPQNLYAQAQDALAEQDRLEKIKAIYQKGLQAMDKGNWKQAQKLFNQVNAQQLGYAETEQLLARVTEEMAQAKLAGKEPRFRFKPWYGLIAVVVILAIGVGIWAIFFSEPEPKPLEAYAMPTSTPGENSDSSSTQAESEQILPEQTEVEQAEAEQSGQETAITRIIEDDHGVPMALIPAGPFLMGNIDGPDEEKPVHTVTLDNFYIDQYEVTNSRYAECVNANICNPPSELGSATRDEYFEDPVYADYPVVFVSWHAAQTYCQWRGARLPTEAEWEKAARGGLAGALYPWGDKAPACNRYAANGANFGDCESGEAQVGSYSPNGYGLYNMAGNVFEWVANGNYAYPDGDPEPTVRNFRGGSFSRPAEDLRVAYRDGNTPDLTSFDVGFRCAQDAALEPDNEPGVTLFDDFSAPDGQLDRDRWGVNCGDASFEDLGGSIENGRLTFLNTPASESQGCNLQVMRGESVPGEALGGIAATLSEEFRQGEMNSNTWVAFLSDPENGLHPFCGVQSWPNQQFALFVVFDYQDEVFYTETEIDSNASHDFRLQADPESMAMRCYVDGTLLGEWVPENPDELRQAEFSRQVEISRLEGAVTLSQVDDVRLLAPRPGSSAEGAPMPGEIGGEITSPDSALEPAPWLFGCDPTMQPYPDGLIVDGRLQLMNTPSDDISRCQLWAQNGERIPGEEVGGMRARVWIGPESEDSRQNTIFLVELEEGHSLTASCGPYALPAGGDLQMIATFEVVEQWGEEGTQHFYNETWIDPQDGHDVYLQIDPDTMAFRCQVDEETLGVWLPEDPDLLRQALFARIIQVENYPQAVATFEISGVEITAPVWRPTAECPQITDWRAEYWDNADLAWAPRLCRDEGFPVHFWANGSPAPEIPADWFSARYTKEMEFEGGQYTFRLSGDDGVRLWLDDEILIDEWQDQGFTDFFSEVNIPPGVHTLRVEYFEHMGDAHIELFATRGDQLLFSLEPGCIQPPEGLIGWWAGDGNPSNQLGGPDGQDINGTSSGPGKIDQAFKFDPSGWEQSRADAVEIPLTPDYEYLQAFTIEAWVFLDTEYAHPHPVEDFIRIEKKFRLGYSDEHLIFTVPYAAQIDNHLTGKEIFPRGEWVHVVGVYNGDEISLFQNAEPVGVAPAQFDLSTTAGAFTLSNPAEPLSGMLDEVSLYNRALTPGEIRLLYYMGGNYGKCK
jgi:serine/threonine protein kinase/formylglycine-generating enzyme required for sulfatase activity